MKHTLNRLGIIICGSLLYALSTCLFVIPHAAVLGGTSGLAVLVHRFLGILSPEQMITLMNIGLMIAAFAVLGRNVAFGTLWGSVFTTGFIFVLDLLFPQADALISNGFISVAIGACLIGVASSLLFFHDASSGGTDILALVVQHYSHIDISKALFVTDIALVALSFWIYSIACGLVSALGFLIKIGTIALLERCRKSPR